MQIPNLSWPSSPQVGSPDSRPARLADIYFAQQADPAARPPAPAAGSPQFDSQLLTALIDVQSSGSLTPSIERLPDINAGEAPMVESPWMRTHRQTGFGVGSADDLPTPGELQGQTADDLAQDLVSRFGSNGSLSCSDVEKALSSASWPADFRAKIKSGIDTNWHAIFGGASSLTTAQLSKAISQYLPANSGAG